MYCSKCGTNISDDVDFCYKCGNKLSIDNPASSISNDAKKFDTEIEKLKKLEKECFKSFIWSGLGGFLFIFLGNSLDNIFGIIVNKRLPDTSVPILILLGWLLIGISVILILISAYLKYNIKMKELA